MCEDDMVAIPVEERQEYTGFVDHSSYTPQWQVSLAWWQTTDDRRRRDTFLVVENASFSVLFSSDRLLDEVEGGSVRPIRGRTKQSGKLGTMRQHQRTWQDTC